MRTTRKCAVCKQVFTKNLPLQKVCGIECAKELVRINGERRSRLETRERINKLKTRSEWLKEAQAACNAFIRERDHDLPCISCGRHHKGQYHAGHYRTTRAAPELRFHPFNINKQCSACNSHLSGNIVEYRKNLIEKIGLANVEWLEGPHQPNHLSIEDIIEIKAFYKQMARSSMVRVASL